MRDLFPMMAPEILLTAVACLLLLLGCSNRLSVRRITPYLAMAGLLAGLALAIWDKMNYGPKVESFTHSVRIDGLVHYIRILGIAVGIILLLLSWPTDDEQTGNSALDFAHDAGEYFSLFLFSLVGLLLVAASNDLIILFLAMELVSIPTYVMVSISRRQSVAQEAGVKYFFLGAMSVAVMLFGFTYLFGTTGTVNFDDMSAFLRRGLASNAAPALTGWQLLGVVLVVLGFAYKMAAFPLHFYAGDVYEGAATPVTAFLAFVPKAAGFVALIRILVVIGGVNFALPHELITLLAVMAFLTMFAGNVLGLLQDNIKRVLAYSSVAHSGYMLVGIAALATAGQPALRGVLFYLAAYGVMNAGAFGVLMLLSDRSGKGSAETFADIAGQGRQHIALGLAMAISCFSLIGIPLTAGFMGKLLLIRPALQGNLVWLVILLIINAAISAAYYLRIVATMFLRPETLPGETAEEPAAPLPAFPLQYAVILGVILSALGTLALGSIPSVTQGLIDSANIGARVLGR